MGEFPYKIVANGVVIAVFLNECDRDYSLDALAEAFNDCEFVALYDEDV